MTRAAPAADTRSMAQPLSTPRAPNLLEEAGLPLAYPVEPMPERHLYAPDRKGHDVSARTIVRSLTVMQKEAIVTRSGSPLAWRLSSDEGPYLQGHDFAPAPLAILTSGFAMDVFANVERSLVAAGHDAPAVQMVLDSRFTMEGSLPRGTMVGGALAPEIEVVVGDPAAMRHAVLTGVMTAASTGLAVEALSAPFSLTSNGRQVPVERVPALAQTPPAPESLPHRFPDPVAVTDEPLISKMAGVGPDTPDAGSSYQQEQLRTLHLRARAARRHDGLLAVETRVHQPIGSTFRFLADEPADGSPAGARAPDALSYLSAGIGFCFMTQIGRYAKIMRRDLGDYHILQDTRFSVGDPTAEPPVGGQAAAPATHVYLAPEPDDEFAAHALAMSEQTCFVHALVRTALRPRVRVTAPG